MMMLIFPLGFALLLWLYLRAPDIRADEEKERTPLFEERCKGRYGRWPGRASPMRVAFYEDFVMIRVLFPWKILYSSIRSVNNTTSFARACIVIDSSSFACKFRIYLREPGKVLSIFSAKGVPIE